MIKTDLTGINGVSRSLLHSKITRQQQAIKLLSEMGSNRRDVTRHFIVDEKSILFSTV